MPNLPNKGATAKKKSLVISRMSKRIKKLGLSGFKEYINYLEDCDFNGDEFQKMIDLLSTNYSLFFREQHHFDFLSTEFLPENHKKEIRIWSAAASTGEEIYSTLITLKEFERINNKKLKHKLYASDISREVLIKASKGIYPSSAIENIQRDTLKKYFLQSWVDKDQFIKVKKDLIRQIKFLKINLSDKLFDLPLMDIIFLRNVIIYFDKETKIELIEKLHSYIKPGGYLILGHSESLSSISKKFTFIRKSIYRRND